MPSPEKRTFGLPTEQAGYKEVVGVYDAMQADPGRPIPGEQVFATLRARHADRIKKPPRES